VTLDDSLHQTNNIPVLTLHALDVHYKLVPVQLILVGNNNLHRNSGRKMCRKSV